jgi:hypothetical protein
VSGPLATKRTYPPRFGNALCGIGFIGGRANQIGSGGAIGTEGVGHGSKAAVGGELLKALPITEPDAQMAHRCGLQKTDSSIADIPVRAVSPSMTE